MPLDAPTTTSDPLLQPFRLKHLTLRNRIMSTSHASGLQEGGLPLERYQAYQEEKARGGIGLTMFGGSSNVSIDSPSVFGALSIGTDEAIPHLAALARRVHAHGAAVMCQITHLGRRAQSDMGEQLPTIAPSPVRETLHRSIPKEVDAFDIARVIADFTATAVRCRDAGLDGIETLAGAHLIGQFLSPSSNRRTDKYGGSLENRCRFGIEVYEAIRKAVGEEFIVGFRFVVDEGHAAGLGFEECVAIARRFEETGTLDFFNAVYGRMDTASGLAYDNMPGMASPIAPWLAKAAAFKQEINLPVFHAARISDIATARHAVRENLIDLVGMTRAHIADPHLVAKLKAGEEERIRPCVGATHCMSALKPACLHNPASGNENRLHQLIRPATNYRKVVVVGGGPGGLEAARVCGERGHDVTLFEAAPKLGGQVLLAAQAHWRGDLVGLVDWRANELARLGVTIHLNTYAEAADISALKPDLVIVATGGVPNIEHLEGHEHITTAWDILSGAAQPGENVLVVDGTGRHVALSAASHCLRAGADVRFAMIDETLAAEQAYAERSVWRKWAHEVALDTIREVQLVSVRAEGNKLCATLCDELTGAMQDVEADQVVFDYGTTPAADTFFGLREVSRNDGVTDLAAFTAGTAQPAMEDADENAGPELHRIGDAVSSRNIHAAIQDALRLCQNC